MTVQSKIRKMLLAFLVALPFGAGCGNELQENGPAEMPNVGPGEPAGFPPGAPRPPSSTGGKTDKASPGTTKK